MSNWDIRFLKVAREVASWSKDPSTQTGAVIVETHTRRLVSVGYNGFPQPMPDKPEWYANREEKYSRIVHCEINALIFAKDIPPESTLYTWPFLSCDRCVVQMIQAGITRFVAPESTPEQLTRWGTAFEKTRRYILECDFEYTEIPHSEIQAG